MGKRVKQVSDKLFKQVWNSALSYSDVSRKLLYNISGNNNKMFREWAGRLKLDVFRLRIPIHMARTKWTKETAFLKFLPGTKCPNNPTLKGLIIKFNLLPKKCAGIGNGCITNSLLEWNGGLLKFELDHINGNRFDCRLENLRLLCGCCHKQTPTHGGGNKAFRTLKP
jgi:hypothetical protein